MAMFGHWNGSRRVRAFTGVPGGYRNPPGSVWALLGHTGIEERGQKEGGTRPPSGPNWTREGGTPFLLSPSTFPSPIPTRKGGVLLPVGVGLPPWRALLLGRPPPPCSFIYGGRGLITHKYRGSQQFPRVEYSTQIY